MDAFSDDCDQIVDKNITKFKEKSTTKKYLKLKPLKLGFKWYFRCAGSIRYLSEIYHSKERY